MSILKKTLYKLAKWIGIILLVLLGLFIVIVLIIRTEWAQSRIVSYATEYASEKTGTRISIDRLFITFGGNVQLEGLYIEDQLQDTLLYSRSLEAGVGIRSLFGETIRISRVKWHGLHADISRGNDSTFNFDFIINAFAGGDSSAVERQDTTSSSPLKISVGPVDLTDFNVSYLDSVAGIEAQLILGTLSLTTDALDLERLRFEAGDLHLANTRARVSQFLSPPPGDEDTSASPLPFISCDRLLLENLDLQYHTVPDTLFAKARVGTLNITGSSINLSEQQILVRTFRFLQNDIHVQLPATQQNNAAVVKDEDSSASPPFNWPEWEIELEELEFADNSLRLDIGRSAPPQNTFDPNHIALKKFTVKLEDVELKDRRAKLKLQHFAFEERCGFLLRELSVRAILDDKELNIDALKMETSNSRLSTSLKLTFPNLDSLLSSPLKNGNMDLNISETSLSLLDAFYFSDSLRRDTLLQKTAAYPLALETRIKGSLDDIDIQSFEAYWLDKTRLAVSGEIFGLPDTNALKVNKLQVDLQTTARDIALLAPPSPGAEYPENITLSNTLDGSAKRLEDHLHLSTSDGSLDLKVTASDLMNIPKYSGNMILSDLKIGKITGNPDLDTLSLKLNYNGSGKTLEQLEFHADVDFQQLRFKNYDYSHLKLTANVKDQKAGLNLHHKDENLDFDLIATAETDKNNTSGELVLNVRGADLHDLNLNSGNLKTAFDLKASFTGRPDAFFSQFHLTNATFRQGEDNYRLDSLFAMLINDSSHTDLHLASEIVDGGLEANTSLQNLASSLKLYLRQVLDSSSIAAKADQHLDMKANFTIANSPLLSEILLPGLNHMDTVTIDAAFKPSDDVLYLHLRAPDIIYEESELQNLLLNMNSNGDTTRISLGFEHLFSDPVEIHNTRFELDITGNSGTATFEILDNEEKEVFYSSAEILKTADKTHIHLDPDHLILNRNQWSILPDNNIELGPGPAVFSDFEISRNTQKVSIHSREDEKSIIADFRDFNLAAVFSILNPHESPVSGSLNGSLEFVDLDQTPAFITDIRLDELTVLGNKIGVLDLKANNRQPRLFQIDLSLKGEEIDFAANGSYSTSGETPVLDMNVDVNRIDLALVQAFLPDEMQKSSGFVSGRFTLDGPTDGLQYKGNLEFNNASFILVMLGTELNLHNEQIDINNEGVHFDNFTLRDENNNTTVIDGQVLTKNLLNPSFDLSIEADKFQFLHSTEEDNELYYGTALIDLDITVKGNLSLPVIEARVGLLKGTEITYVIPATQAHIQERKGIVRFENMKDTSYSILDEEEANTSVLKGMDIHAYLNVDPATRFIVVVDPQSGDNLTVTGEANLNFELNPNGNMNMSGAYELKSGAYKLSLYELVKKEFDIVPGSRIEWNGDPTNADLNITAMYKIEAAPADLFSDQLSGADATTLNRYKQKVPFEVMLYIRGSLNQPDISFGLDMPDNSRNALGGSVYGRVQQVNEDESELNKQVFSLIVFNRFLPSDVASAGGGGTSELARSSVSKLLSNQLNSLSEKYIHGVELNFDLDSYTDYQTGAAQQRTDLNVSLKKGFFNERVIVEVGSQVGVEGQGQRPDNEIVGDVSVEYLLMENGRYRLRAFRKNQFQDLIEGQVIITGLAILFNKEFDTWKELMQSQDDKETDSSSPGDTNNKKSPSPAEAPKGKGTENKNETEAEE